MKGLLLNTVLSSPEDSNNRRGRKRRRVYLQREREREREEALEYRGEAIENE